MGPKKGPESYATSSSASSSSKKKGKEPEEAEARPASAKGGKKGKEPAPPPEPEKGKKAGGKGGKDTPPPTEPPKPDERKTLFGDWTGKTPKTFLNEYCQKNHRPKPEWQQISCPGGRFRFRVKIPKIPTLKNDAERLFEDGENFPSVAEAQHHMAVVALHGLNPDNPMYRILPTAYKELWRSLTEKHAVAQEEAKRAAKEAAEAAEREKENAAAQQTTKKLTAVHLDADTRALVERVIRENSRDASALAADQSSQELLEELAGKKREESEVRKLITQLANLGFDKADADQAARASSDLAGALDWLMLNVPEHLLPKAFEPSKGIQVVAFANQKKGGEGKNKAEGENGGEAGGPGDAGARIRDLGWPQGYASWALQKARGDSRAALFLLLGLLVDGGQRPPGGALVKEEDLAAQREEELVALESIFGTQLYRFPEGDGLSVTFEDPAVVGPCTVEFFFPKECLYPSRAPLVSFTAISLPPRARLHATVRLAEQAVAQAGVPVVFSLVMFLQSSLPMILAGANGEPALPPIPRAPSPPAPPAPGTGAAAPTLNKDGTFKCVTLEVDAETSEEIRRNIRFKEQQRAEEEEAKKRAAAEEEAVAAAAVAAGNDPAAAVAAHKASLARAAAKGRGKGGAGAGGGKAGGKGGAKGGKAAAEEGPAAPSAAPAAPAGSLKADVPKPPAPPVLQEGASESWEELDSPAAAVEAAPQAAPAPAAAPPAPPPPADDTASVSSGSTVYRGADKPGAGGGRRGGRGPPARPPHAAEDPAHLARLRAAAKAWAESGEGSRVAAARGRLPAASFRSQVLAAVASNQVVLVRGETGCGKSTQVPQFILEAALEAGEYCSIVCTQPRRISAIGVAERVAYERGEKAGATVGYQVRLESVASRETRLLFATTGVLLRKLQSDPRLARCTHLLIDEVHERSLDSDFLLVILKRLLPARPDLKVVLMSATINAHLFSNYFAGCPAVDIPGFTHPVKEYFLEDTLEFCDGYALEWRPSRKRNQSRAAAAAAAAAAGGGDGPAAAEEATSFDELAEASAQYKGYSERTVKALVTLSDNEEQINYDLVEALVMKIHTEESEGAILIFLPGIQEIQAVHERLRGVRGLLLLPLHSTLASSDQKRIFERAPPNTRKVVIATNIAETSITVDDCVYVVDAGRVKENQYDAATRLTALVETWVSKASAKQRRGRAGRVRPGRCFRLFTRRRHEAMAEQQLPEMLRVPLEQLCLQIEVLGYGDPQAFLGEALQPPPREQVEAAVMVLKEIGALNAEGGATPLGRHLASLPVDVRVGKMLLLASVFQCVDPILTIAAGLSSRSPFVAPLEKRDEANKAKRGMAVGRSDHLTTLRAYNGWLDARSQGRDDAYCNEHFLSRQTLRTMSDLRHQFADLLRDIGFEAKGARANAQAKNVKLVRAVLAAGLYPNVVSVELPETKYAETAGGSMAKDHKAREITHSTKHDGRVHLHPGSVNFASTDFESRWLVFLEKVKTNKVFIRDSSMVSPFALLLFGGPISVDHQRAVVAVDGWIEFHAPARVAVLARELRALVDELLERKLAEPRTDVAASPVVRAITQVLSQE